MVERGHVVLSAMLVCGAVSVAAAQPRAKMPPKVPAKAAPPVVTGTNVVMTLTPTSGFVDEVIAIDPQTQRVGYVISDGSTRAELHVVQLGCAKCIELGQESIVDLAPVTLRPTSLTLVGQRAFVIGAAEDGNQIAALVELTQREAKKIYSLGPAAHITLLPRDGTTRIAVHKMSATKQGTRHDVELFALDTGKRVARGKSFDLEQDRNKKLDFRVNHWADGWTRAIGFKGGKWVKKEDQRSPDTEAVYDLVKNKFVEDKAIANVVEQRKRFQQLADAGGQLDFLRMTWDNSSVQLWHHGLAREIGLDQSLQLYDPKTLQGVVNADGSAWLALKIDPVNPDAVARKKADVEYVDVFRVGPGETQAVRKARLPAKNLRFHFGVLGNYFWVLERSTGFDRGGRTITIYNLPS